jgi:hypothetical protein
MTATPAPAPEMPPWKFRQLNEAERKVRDLQEALEVANVELRKFRTDNCVVLGTQMYFRCATIDGRAALDQQWRELVLTRDRLLQQWNAALAEFAEVNAPKSIGGNHAT